MTTASILFKMLSLIYKRMPCPCPCPWFNSVLTQISIFNDRHQTRTLLTTLFQYYNDLPRFKSALRDFLVQLREFSGDNADLYLEEREKESQKGAQERLEVAMWIPGMVKPNQLEDNEDHHDIYVSGS